MTAGSATALSHLLAMRAPAAWNARRAIQAAQRPTLIVSDKFGDGPLSSHVDATCPGCVLGVGNPEPASHGYHVVGIAAGSFANDGTSRGLVTGVFPAQTRLKVVDLNDQTVGAGVVRTLQAVRATSGRVVLNTSWGHSEVSDRDSRDEGNDWASEIRDGGLHQRLLHAAAAGNEARPAELFSEWNAAALRRDLVDAGGTGVPPLPNTLITENLVDTGAPRVRSGLPRPGLEHRRPHRGGRHGCLLPHQAARGQLGAGAGGRGRPDRHLAGVAPGRRAGRVRVVDRARSLAHADRLAADRHRAVTARRRGRPAATGTSARRLDAYAAVLSLDQAATVAPAGAPVRLAILDRTEDDKFDDADLAAHAAAIAAGSQGTRDWGRSDLNGDGFTGVGQDPTPFDLDPSDSTRAGAPISGCPRARASRAPPSPSTRTRCPTSRSSATTRTRRSTPGPTRPPRRGPHD